MSDTIFGKISRGEIPADIVYQDEAVVAFRDLNPQAPTHVLVIPRKPIPTLNALEVEDAELVGKLFLAADDRGAHGDRGGRLSHRHQLQCRRGTDGLPPASASAGWPADGLAAGLMKDVTEAFSLIFRRSRITSTR